MQKILLAKTDNHKKRTFCLFLNFQNENVPSKFSLRLEYALVPRLDPVSHVQLSQAHKPISPYP